MSNENKTSGHVSNNNTRRAFIRATGGTVAVGALAGCTSFLDGGGNSDTITISSLQPFSGGFAPWGSAHSAGVEFAVEEINNDGGVLDMDLEVVEADTGSEPSEADSLFRQHVEQDGAVAGVGPVSSDVGIRVRQTASDLEAPLLLHMAGSHRILPKNQEYTFRLGSHSAPTDMRSVVGLMEEQGYSKVGAIVADYEWGRSVETTIGQLIPDDIDLSMEVAPLTADDFTPIIRNLPNDIEFMIGSGHPPGAPTIHAQARELGYEHEFTVGAGIPPSVLSEALGDLASSFGHQHVSDPFSDQFASVGERYGEARDSMFSTHHAYGYASIDIFAKAIEAAGSTNRDDIAAAMVDTEFDTLLANPIDYVEYGEVQDLVHMLSTVESGAPEYYSDGSFQLSELYRSDPLPAFDPDNWDFSG